MHTVTLNSVLGLRPDTETCVALDEDQFGRKMFICYGSSYAYSERSTDDIFIYAIIILQKTEGGFAYFYPDRNFILAQGDPSWPDVWPTDEELVQHRFTLGIEGEIEELRLANDWGEPLDESAMARVRVLQTMGQIESRNSTVPWEAFYEVLAHAADSGERGRPIYVILTSDAYGRHLYFFRHVLEDGACAGSYVVIVNGDGSYDPDGGVMQITDVWDYQDDLRGFKERNGWDAPPASRGERLPGPQALAGHRHTLREEGVREEGESFLVA